MDAALEMRAKINSAWPEGKLSVNDLVVKAVSLALIEHPGINASWSERALLRHASVDVAVAVATENGLYTPIVRDAHTKTVKAIANETKTLAERARAGRLQPSEYQGGGITISNLGMYGVSEFAAIINPPHAAILAIGAAEQRAIAIDGEVRVATMMTCTLSADHRIVDGALGATFLAKIKNLLEEPLALLA
jgi:pyruvate dehydrogenase E2 component (dihydrolipoamide acetyltransferase)